MIVLLRYIKGGFFSIFEGGGVLVLAMIKFAKSLKTSKSSLSPVGDGGGVHDSIFTMVLDLMLAFKGCPFGKNLVTHF